MVGVPTAYMRDCGAMKMVWGCVRNSAACPLAACCDPGGPHCAPLAGYLFAGENPHQAAAFYIDESLREAGLGGVATSIVHWGKELSYNNYVSDAFTANKYIFTIHGLQCCLLSSPVWATYPMGVRFDSFAAFIHKYSAAQVHALTPV